MNYINKKFFYCIYMISITGIKSISYELFFLQPPSYKIIFLDLFKIYVSAYQFIMILLLCFIFIYSHLLLLFLLIKLDNVRSSLFCLSLSFTIFFSIFFFLQTPSFILHLLVYSLQPLCMHHFLNLYLFFSSEDLRFYHKNISFPISKKIKKTL